MFIHNNLYYNGFDQTTEGLDEGSNVDFFFFEKINIEENPFLFVTTPATNILWILPVYFGDVHDVPQRCKTCQLAEFRSVEPSCL